MEMFAVSDRMYEMTGVKKNPSPTYCKVTGRWKITISTLVNSTLLFSTIVTLAVQSLVRQVSASIEHKLSLSELF